MHVCSDIKAKIALANGCRVCTALRSEKSYTLGNVYTEIVIFVNVISIMCVWISLKLWQRLSPDDTHQITFRGFAKLCFRILRLARCHMSQLDIEVVPMQRRGIMATEGFNLLTEHCVLVLVVMKSGYGTLHRGESQRSDPLTIFDTYMNFCDIPTAKSLFMQLFWLVTGDIICIRLLKQANLSGLVIRRVWWASCGWVAIYFRCGTPMLWKWGMGGRLWFQKHRNKMIPARTDPEVSA